jgi:3' terminal RNA ribose 2'-O-methyltransferase Hen1
VLLTLTLTRPPANDLGYLLHKSPGRVHTRSTAFGSAHVFYPEASEDRCTAALLLDIDPVGLVRGRRQGPSLEPYVTDRPYVASSFMSTAIAEMFGTAMSGRSKERQALADEALPFEVRVPVLPVRGSDDIVERLFGSLGYVATTTRPPLDERFPSWGAAPYVDVRLSATVRLRDLLGHLYVLIPVLDDQKHYWVSAPEIEKLLHRGADWLPTHPDRELITRRYLARQADLTREALRRLSAAEVPDDPDEVAAVHDAEETAVEARISLHSRRIDAVLGALRDAGVKRVVDLGCGEGRLLTELVADHAFTEIVGMDVSARSLEIAARRLRVARMNERQAARLRLIHGSLTYRDDRIAGFDAGVLLEVIEHLEPDRLASLERVVFGEARPALVVVTTPNVEYNVRLGSLPAGRMRHRDHRFEWTRAEFGGWAERVAERFGYGVRVAPIGEDDAEVGPPSQMAVFSRD